LEATYDQILSRIPPADASDAVKLLLWLAFAHEPLHIDYLSIIVEFDIDEKAFNSDAKLSSSEDILNICSSLVTKMGDNTVQLAHASVQTYVQEKSRIIQPGIFMDPSIGNTFVGQASLMYLLHTRETHPSHQTYILEKPIRERYQQSLIRYSAKYWPRHMVATNEGAADIDKMKKIFVGNSFGFHNWVKVYNYDIHDCHTLSQTLYPEHMLRACFDISPLVTPHVDKDTLYPTSCRTHVL
jgi:hypothetical protein